VRDGQSEGKPAGVPARAKQAGESQEIWALGWNRLLDRTACWRPPKLGSKSCLCWPWAVLPSHSLRSGPSILSEVKPPTGEPDAGDPPVRFGGRGDRVLNRSSLPLFGFGEIRTALLARPFRPHRLPGSLGTQGTALG
jgi:hypothetical protein